MLPRIEVSMALSSGDPTQDFRRDWRAGRLVHVKELAPGVRPTGRQHDIAARGQPLEPGITINLQDAMKSFEVRGGSIRLAIGTAGIPGGAYATIGWGS